MNNNNFHDRPRRSQGRPFSDGPRRFGPSRGGDRFHSAAPRAPRPVATEEVLKITGFDEQGLGVAIASTGRVLLPYCAEGDLVRAKINPPAAPPVDEKEKARRASNARGPRPAAPPTKAETDAAARAARRNASFVIAQEKPSGEILEIMRPGAGRIAPKCPLFFKPCAARWCGGCDFQHLGYDAQLKAKHDIAAACLQKAGLSTVLEPTLPSPAHWRYRNKMQLPFAKFGGKVVAGFFRPGSHDIVDFSDCAVQSEAAVKIALEIKAEADHSGWSIYNEDENEGWLRHILLRTNSQNEAMLTFVGNGEPRFNLAAAVNKLVWRLPQIKSVYLNIQTEQTSVILGRRWEKLSGEVQLEETICGRKFLFYPGSFLQVNTPAAQELYKTAAQFLSQGERTAELYDLYCGIGVIGITVGAGFKRLTGIEENAGAAACAWKNARHNNIRNARFVAAKAEDYFSKGTSIHHTAAVIMDPPRSGCAPKLLAALDNPLVKKIVYISCNPATFARDARSLIKSGFELKRVKPADLFPQTAQVELVSYFERPKSR